MNSWHELNKPHVLLFDQVPVVPLLFKVGAHTAVIFTIKCTFVANHSERITNTDTNHLSPQLTAFAYKDYLQFGYVDQGLSETADLQKQFNINTYAPTMLVFKENTDKPADIIQVRPSGRELEGRRKQSHFLHLVTVISALK